jgi:hypothetical protein
VETTKCPACGASNSAKRQICHICGQLLSETLGQGDSGASIHLLSEDLKAVTEAALREVSKSQLASSADAKAGTKSGAKAGKASPAGATFRPQTNRDRTIILIAAAIAIAALIFIIIYLARPAFPGGGMSEAAPETTTPPTTTTTTTNTNNRPIKPNATPGPVITVNPPATTPAPAPVNNPPVTNTNNPQLGGYEQIAIKSIKSAVTSLVSKVNGDIGSAFPGNKLTFNGSISSNTESTAEASVTFSTTGMSGSARVLMRKYGDNWQATDCKDINMSFAPAITVTVQDEQRAVTGATAGSGLYEPISSLAGAAISYRYQQD